MGSSKKSQHAIRRSTRLPLEVPVLITSLDAAAPFSERCHTTLVNAHGCGLIVPRALAQGIQIRLEIVSAKRHTTARVAEVVPLGGDPETWLIGLELEVPGNFWGIEYAPTDWRIEESAPAAREPRPHGEHKDDTVKEPISPSKPVRPSRWRLTDISAGACYLETAEPFPADTPVVLSIRSSNAECLLDGLVRVAHPQTGMGVEFTGADASELRTQVEELIGHLTGNQEVPRIFVGRKEGRKPGAKEDKKMARPNPNPGAAQDPESPDALLELVRSATELPAERFLSDLRAQRQGTRRDPRIAIALPVLLAGTDVSGRPLDQRVMTLNVSRRGALLGGIHGVLGQGDVVSLARLHKKEQFRVAWVGEEGTAAAGRIGVAAIDPNTSFWDDVPAITAFSSVETASPRRQNG